MRFPLWRKRKKTFFSLRWEFAESKGKYRSDLGNRINKKYQIRVNYVEKHSPCIASMDFFLYGEPFVSLLSCPSAPQRNYFPLDFLTPVEKNETRAGEKRSNFQIRVAIVFAPPTFDAILLVEGGHVDGFGRRHLDRAARDGLRVAEALRLPADGPQLPALLLLLPLLPAGNALVHDEFQFAPFGGGSSVFESFSPILFCRGGEEETHGFLPVESSFSAKSSLADINRESLMKEKKPRNKIPIMAY